MVRGIERREKRYVDVLALWRADGSCTPLAIMMDGVRYDIDGVGEVRRAASMKVGGYGWRFSITVRGRPKHLWCDDRGWYVEQIISCGETSMAEP